MGSFLTVVTLFTRYTSEVFQDLFVPFTISLFTNFTSLGRLGELSKVMQTRNAVVGLHNFPEFFQSPSGM